MGRMLLVGLAVAVISGCASRQAPPPEPYKLDPVAYYGEAAGGDPTGFGMERQFPANRSQVARNQRRAIDLQRMQAAPGLREVWVKDERGRFEPVIIEP